MRELTLRSSLQELDLPMPLTAQACDLLVATGKRQSDLRQDSNLHLYGILAAVLPIVLLNYASIEAAG